MQYWWSHNSEAFQLAFLFKSTCTCHACVLAWAQRMAYKAYPTDKKWKEGAKRLAVITCMAWGVMRKIPSLVAGIPLQIGHCSYESIWSLQLASNGLGSGFQDSTEYVVSTWYCLHHQSLGLQACGELPAPAHHLQLKFPMPLTLIAYATRWAHMHDAPVMSRFYHLLIEFGFTKCTRVCYL